MKAVEMVVDDVIAVSSGADAESNLKQFDKIYATTCRDIGLSSKPDDDSAFKAFSCRSIGEVR